LDASLQFNCFQEDNSTWTWQWTLNGTVVGTSPQLVIQPNTLEAGGTYTFQVEAFAPPGSNSTVDSTTNQVTIMIVRSTPIADFQPAGGIKIPQELQLDATGSQDLDYPGDISHLIFIWDCQSDTSTVCPSFLAQANNGGLYNNPTPTLDLQELILSILLSRSVLVSAALVLIRSRISMKELR